MEALRADGEGASAGGADQEEPGGEAEEEVTNGKPAHLKTRGVVIPTLDPEMEGMILSVLDNSGCQFNGTKKGTNKAQKRACDGKMTIEVTSRLLM